MVEPAVRRGRPTLLHQAGHRQDACSTQRAAPAGCCSVAEEYLRDLNPDGQLEVFGQELNAETYAICRSDMMLKGQDAAEHRVRQLASPRTASTAARFDYMLANPPFGVEWKKVEDAGQGRARHARLRRPLRRRAAADQRRQLPLPAAHDPQDEARRTRAAHGSRSSSTARRCSPAPRARASREIRRWIIENDWLEAVVALPDQLFYNTGISHLLLDRHEPQGASSGAGRVQLDRRSRPVGQDAQVASARSASRSPTRQIAEITRWYGGLRGDRDKQSLRQRRVRVPARDGPTAAARERRRRGRGRAPR